MATNPLPPKARTAIPRQHMPEQEAAERAHNFSEVNLGFNFDITKQEALRCLACANPK